MEKMKKSKYNVAVIGAGVVGLEMLRVLKQRNFPVNQLKVFARSARDINVDGQIYSVESITPDGFNGIDIALFAGTEGEKGAAVTFAAEAVKRGAVVIDNGADFRMDPKVPLVVPEVNARDLNLIRNWLLVKKHRPEGRGLASGSQSHKGIIANPNCSTIQMVVALNPIHKKFRIKRIIVTTLQASSGAGKGAVEQLNNEITQIAQGMFNSVQVNVANRSMPQQLAYNCFPHIGSFAEGDYTDEEWKLVKETHKIMHAPKIKISATTVRVPVRIGHSESIYIETEKAATPYEARKILANSAGIIVIDEPKKNLYPMPKDVEGKDETFVGRIRQDVFNKKGLWLWVVADNLRKGAATNAVQIAECLISSSKLNTTVRIIMAGRCKTT
ncbi:MAG: aspartate-semialdehyde dehydrogenase [Candidatus Omnitrophica bacterium]|nr:aspartate-semialdehyde dehydrogenase [Candidatus Omnitrophota bacterium]